MSFHGYNNAVMSSKAFCTVLIGLILRLMVCDAECENNFRKNITRCLFKDHWIAVKNFTPPAESEKDEHILLSVINTLCSTWKQNGERLKNECRNDARNCTDCLEKVMWTYGNILKRFARLNNSNETDNITKFCENYTCKDSYTTYFIRTIDFVDICYKICNWNESLSAGIPKCPNIQNSTTCSCIIKEATHTTIPSTNENVSSHFSVPVPTTMSTLLSEATHTTIPSTNENVSSHFSVPVPTTMKATHTTIPSTNENVSVHFSVPVPTIMSLVSVILSLSLLANIIFFVLWVQQRRRPHNHNCQNNRNSFHSHEATADISLYCPLHSSSDSDKSSMDRFVLFRKSSTDSCECPHTS